MTALLDTNILLRIATPNHPMHTTARHAVSKLQADGVRLVLVPQIVYEYWVVATRPAKENGLGMTPLEAKQACIRRSFIYLLRRSRFNRSCTSSSLSGLQYSSSACLSASSSSLRNTSICFTSLASIETNQGRVVA